MADTRGCSSMPDSDLVVESGADVDRVPADAECVFVAGLNDEILRLIAARLTGLRRLRSDGNATNLTDRGVSYLEAHASLEEIDLEWSSITDASIPVLASIANLRWVDLGFCAGITPRGRRSLRRARPEVEVEAEGTDDSA